MIKEINLKIASAIILICLTFNVFSQTPTKWRGPEGTGIYQETDLLKVWPENGPDVLWVYKGLDKGHSSPAFANGKIYLTTMIDTMGYLVVLSNDGKLIHQEPYGAEWYESWDGARSTPTIVGNLAYVLSSKGKLFCMDLKDYKIKWEKNIFSDFDGVNIKWGVTESVLVNGDLLYCSPGGKKNNVVAVNRFNGELVWSCAGKGDVSAYCTPLLINLADKQLLVTIMAENILGIDAKTGVLLWSYTKTNKWSVHANTPYYEKGELYCFGGYGSGGVKLKLSADGSSVTKIWENESLDNKMGGVVLMDGYIYGSGDKYREWKCLNWETGEQLWESKEIGRGVVIAADGLLYCYADNGELALVKPDTAGFKIISKIKIEDGTAQHWAHPVINQGRLFIRHGDALIAYKIK